MIYFQTVGPVFWRTWRVNWFTFERVFNGRAFCTYSLRTDFMVVSKFLHYLVRYTEFTIL